MGLVIWITIFFLIALGFFFKAEVDEKNEGIYLLFCCLMGLIAFLLFVAGCLHGFINYPKTEGQQVGIITTVQLEGTYFRRYEVYIKSGDTDSVKGTNGDEVCYKIYADEEELASLLKEYIGKEVKITYGHDGGYIGWNSCGKDHIKSVELIEEEQ